MIDDQTWLGIAEPLVVWVEDRFGARAAWFVAAICVVLPISAAIAVIGWFLT